MLQNLLAKGHSASRKLEFLLAKCSLRKKLGKTMRQNAPDDQTSAKPRGNVLSMTSRVSFPLANYSRRSELGKTMWEYPDCQFPQTPKGAYWQLI